MLRTLEPEVMDSWEDAVDYDAMDFLAVNTAFAQTASDLCLLEQAKVLDAGTIDRLVKEIGMEYSDRQQDLFRDSLHAAFTIDEVEQLIAQAEIPGVKIYQSSDRHWTVERGWGLGTRSSGYL